MAEIYPKWAAAHGVMIVTPVNWYQAPTGLKAMIDPDGTDSHVSSFLPFAESAGLSGE
jgi:multimeric flavodoxin WrbA